MGLVYAVVKRGTPRNLTHEEAVSAGLLALVEAAQKFDPNRGIKWATWATAKIRYAIVDESRAEHRQTSGFGPLENPDRREATGNEVKQDEARLHVQDLLDLAYTMDERDRRIIRDFLDGVDLSDTAKTIGVRLSRAYVIRNRAFIRLRKLAERADCGR